MKEIFYRWLAKWRLVRRYRYLNEVNKILEAYLTSRIINGGSEDFITKARRDLVEKQNEIKENNGFINFLRKQ